MSNDVFRTIVKIDPAEIPIRPESRVLFMGSCFADNIGKQMVESRFKAITNPFGVLYNPISILQAFNNILSNKKTEENDLFLHNHLWHSFHHHGKFSKTTPEKSIEEINNSTLKAHLFLQKTDFIIVTFGTAFVYQHKELKQVVANCHKFPSNYFNRYLLNSDEIVEEWKNLIINLRVFNPSIKLIFTLSPVRHWKDGAHGNQLSKSTLLLAIEKLTSLFEQAWYFPAYEIMMDELRDYRFYDGDMLQPNQVAIDYIWKRFAESQLSRSAQNFYREAIKIQRARQHKPSGNMTPDYLNFLRSTLEQINSIATRYPETLIEKDKEHFDKLLASSSRHSSDD
ncbi:GSCFA domain-containing protein [Alkalitalea saponilacus]|uniref:GSCFA family protein n=1 Tax=Alkalitalea saponilacus TaxID=889453 RepID=A0A1T5FU14_9BACT|nr:GSCFA domain-containing protein [Alkalitalea saponilacus]ASB49494.1 hypothetical protein CDL62_10255 [Alkalitalea saponilacus]SKB99668.1 GSCFA family protein [Alkalitalea saponilacus]